MSDLAPVAPAPTALRGEPDGRPSWWQVVGQALLAWLLLFAVQAVPLVLAAALPFDGLDAIAGRFFGLGERMSPPFAGAPLANAAAYMLLALAVAAALSLTVRSRSGEGPRLVWMLLAAVPALAWLRGGSDFLAALVTLVIIRQCGFREDGSPRPAFLSRGATLAAAGVLVLGGSGVVLARVWTDPLIFPPGSSWDPVYAPVRARELAPADRVRRAGALRLLVQNASPRSTTVTSVRFAGDGNQPRVLGLRRMPTGMYSGKAPRYLPSRPVRIAPGGQATLTVLVAGGCPSMPARSVRVGTTTGTSTLRLAHLADGLHCRSR